MVDSRAIKRQAPSTYKGSNYKHRTKAHAPVIHTSNADSLKQDYGYIGARNDTTRPSRHTPDKDVDITDITVYVSCYTVTDTAGMLSPPTVWRFSVPADINSNVFDSYFLTWSLSRLLCCVGSGFNVAATFG